MWWLLLWPLAGLLGWGWMNYCAYLAIGERADQEPEKWKFFRWSPVLGPGMILLHWSFMRSRGHMHFGLRFK